MAARAHLVLGVVCFLLLAGCADSTTANQTTPFPEEQSAAAFGTVRGDVTTARTITIQKPFVPGANVVLEDSAGPFSTAPGEPSATAGTGIQFSLRVIFDPTVPSLTQSSTAATGFIRIRFTKQDGSLTNTTLVSLTAAVEVPAPLVFQNTLDFGPTAFGENITTSFTVTNPNAVTPLDLESAVVSGGAFTLPGLALPLTVPPQTTFIVNANYTPPGTGSHTANVSMTSSVGGPFSTTLLGQGIPSEVVTDLGFIPLEPSGDTPWVEFTVGRDAISIHIEIIADDPSADFFLIGLEGPGGRIYENETFSAPYEWFLNFPVGFAALFLQLPNSDDPDVRLVPGGGTYRFRLAEFSPFVSGYDVRVIVEQRHKGGVTDGLLPLNVFIADGVAVSAAAAPTDPTFQTILSTMDALFALRGLRLGDVSYFKLSDPAYDDISSFAEFEALQMESATAPEARLNLFFVNGISTFDDALGVAGGAPGVKRNGTAWSGVIMDFDATSAVITGATTAHEAGHYLGLFHTTEFDILGNIIDFDLILDTPICFLNEIDFECETIGDSNLMWSFDLGFAIGLQLSRGQADVIKKHPLVDPGTVPAPPAKLAQLGGGGVLPIGVLRSWCANCAGRLRR